jgi:endonuclease-3
MDCKNLAQAIHYRLLAYFGEPEWTKRPALDELILTVLSQNTNDRNRDIAYNAMREKYPTWADVHHANPEELIDSVRYAGLANQKAPRIQAILDTVYDTSGEYSLDFLTGFNPDQVMEWLTSLKGVGSKTASIVMVFSLEMPAFPVDTHVYRVSGRIGLRDSHLNVEQTHLELAKLYSPNQFGAAHLLLIFLGRQICKARKPKCEQCPINDLCQYEDKTA